MQVSTGSLTPRRLARVTLAGIVLTVICAGAAAAGGDKIWTAVKSSGSAEVQRNGAGWTALKAGVRVLPGNRIRTGPNGSVEFTQNGDSMTVAPNSRAMIAVRRAGSRTANVKQSFGTLLFKIVKRSEGAEKFRVSTPYLAAVIKGTTFSVTVNDTGAALHVAKGLVQVESRFTRQVSLVRPGQTAAVSAKHGASVKVTGGKAKAENGNTPRGGNDGPAASNGNGKGVIKNAIGGGGIDVFTATHGLVENHGTAVGQGRGSSGKSVGASAKGGAINFKKVLKSVNKATSAAKSNASNAGGRGKKAKKAKKDK